MNQSATNYNGEAKKEDGPCKYPLPPEDSRDKYLGNYLVTDSLFLFGSFSEVKSYSLQITKGNTIKDTIILNNLCNSEVVL